MTIKRFIIKNFRSYYGEKIFVLSERLNLILGSNGDGKTTFFEAINWVLTYKEDPNIPLPQNESLISAKFLNELPEGKSGEVSVKLEVLNNLNKTRLIERSFVVTKQAGGKVLISSPKHCAYLVAANGTKTPMNSLVELFERENVMPGMAKKYSVFKGEDDLNIFKDTTTLTNLIDMYSDIKDMEPYIAYAQFAVEQYQTVVKKFQDANNSRSTKQVRLQNDIDSIKRLIEDNQRRLSIHEDNLEDLNGKLAAISEDMTLLSEVHDMRAEIERLTKDEQKYQESLKENYNIQLLDSLWILHAFSPFMKEYNEKMQKLSQLRHDKEIEYVSEITKEFYKEQLKEEVKQEAIEEVKKELKDMPLSKSESAIIRKMMNEHRCSFCGTEAPEGSAAYQFMKSRLQRTLDQIAESQAEKVQKPVSKPMPEIPPYYVDNNIDEMRVMGEQLNKRAYFIDGRKNDIEKQIALNQTIHMNIDRVNAKIDELELLLSAKRKTSAQTQ